MKIKYSLNTLMPIILFSAVAVSVVVLFLAPSIFKAVKTYQELTDLRKKILVLSSKSEVLEKINLDDLKDKEGRINYYLPSNKDVSILMDSISMMTSQTGIAFESMNLAPGELATPSAKLAEKDFLTLEVSITLSGDMPSFIKFINNMGKASPVVKIETVIVSKNIQLTGLSSAKPYRFDVVLVTYYKPISGSMGTISEQVKSLSDKDSKYLMTLPISPFGKGSEDVGEVNYNKGRADPFSRF